MVSITFADEKTIGGKIVDFSQDNQGKKYCRLKRIESGFMREEPIIKDSKVVGLRVNLLRKIPKPFLPLVPFMCMKKDNVIEYIEDKDGMYNGRFLAESKWGGLLLGQFKDSEIYGEVLLNYGTIFVVPLDKPELVNLPIFVKGKKIPLKTMSLDLSVEEDIDLLHFLNRARRDSFVLYP